MAKAETVNAVVVGAGIASASAAWHLAEHATVAIVEQEDQPGVHATGAENSQPASSLTQ